MEIGKHPKNYSMNSIQNFISHWMLVLHPRMPKYLISIPRTHFSEYGKGEYGAILRMEWAFGNGLEKAMNLHLMGMLKSWLCCYQQERIHHGFITTVFTHNLSDSLLED